MNSSDGRLPDDIGYWSEVWSPFVYSRMVADDYRYPNLAKILDDQPCTPKYNRIENNVLCDGLVSLGLNEVCYIQPHSQPYCGRRHLHLQQILCPHFAMLLTITGCHTILGIDYRKQHCGELLLAGLILVSQAANVGLSARQLY